MTVAAFFTAWWLLSTLTLWALLGAHVAVPWALLWAVLFPLDLAWRRYATWIIYERTRKETYQ